MEARPIGPIEHSTGKGMYLSDGLHDLTLAQTHACGQRGFQGAQSCSCCWEGVLQPS